jgi:mRNA interferase MazF
MSDPQYSPGDVVVVPFPYSDQSAAKLRPALVVSNDSYNISNLDVVLCGMTSNLADSTFSVFVGPQDMESGRLAAPSRVKVGRLLAVDKKIIHKKVGRVNSRVFAHVMREFEAIFT